MRRLHVLFCMVRADFLERLRRYSFLLTMVFTLYLGYAIHAGQISLSLDSYHGAPNSAWLGSVVGLVGSVFLSLVGFYVVKNTIQRDRRTRVGRILAATPMSGTLYTLSKTLSNFAVLSAMVLLVAGEAIVVQWTQKGLGSVHLFDLLSPILAFSLSAVSVTSALAVVFETIPGLRSGAGNIAYFFLWCSLLSLSTAALVSGTSPGNLAALSDYAGVATILGQMQAQVRQLDSGYAGGSSLAVGSFHHATKTFVWLGLRWTPAIVLGRAFWVGVAVSLTLLAAGLFDRFDPARENVSLERGKRQQAITRQEEVETKPLQARQSQLTVRDLTPFALRAKRSHFVALVLAELRLLLCGRSWWWHAIAAALFFGCLFAPLAAARSGIILVAWLLPALQWSQLGTRELQFSTQALIFSAPHAFPRQLMASWTAGVLLAVITGGGLGLHLIFAREWQGLLAWAAGTLFIPALALMLGVWFEEPKAFEAMYSLWWYIGPLHHVRKLDFMGSGGTSSTPILYLAATMGLLLLSCSWRKARLSLT